MSGLFSNLEQDMAAPTALSPAAGTKLASLQRMIAKSSIAPSTSLQASITDVPGGAIPVVNNNSGSLNMLTMTIGTSPATMTASNSPTSWSITAGNTNNYFGINSSGVVSVNWWGLFGIIPTTYSLTIQATNAAGSGSGTLTVTSSNPSGHVYYLAASGGNDSNAGTAVGAPWATLTHALTAVAAGDIVLIRGGTYTLPSPYYFFGKAGTSSLPIIFEAYNNEVPIFSGSGTATGYMAMNSAYNQLRGVSVTGAHTTSTNPAIAVYAATTVSVLFCNVYNNWGSGIWVGANSAGIVTNCTVYGCNVYQNCQNNANNALGSGGGWGQGITGVYADSINIQNNTVYQNWGEGIGPQYCQNASTTGNTAYDNFSVNIYPDNAIGNNVSDNFVYSSNSTYYRGGVPNDGIRFSRETAVYTVSNVICTNNIVVGTLYGIYLAAYGSSCPITNGVFAGNTLVQNYSANLYVAATGSSGCIFRDNICYNSGGTTASGSVTGFTCDHNCWYNGSAGVFAGTGDITSNPLFVSSTPSTATTAASLELQAGSPCIGAGVAVSQLTQDYLLNARGSPPSIGAFNGAT